MIRTVMENANLAVFPTIAISIFAGWFGLTLLWLYRKKSGRLYQELSQMPLQDSPPPARSAGAPLPAHSTFREDRS